MQIFYYQSQLNLWLVGGYLAFKWWRAILDSGPTKIAIQI
jgi:hypothetical protein